MSVKYAMIVATLMLATACVKPTTSSPRGSLGEISLEQERQQAYVSEQVSKERKRLAELAEYIIEAGHDLCDAWGKPLGECDYRFRLDDDDMQEFNAYADGENIIVTYRMASFTRTDDELGFILAHEFAHNLMEHVRASKTNSYAGMGLGFVADVLAAAAGVNTQGAFAKLGARAGQQAYSVEFEREADYIGMYIAYNAGFEIDGAADFWRRMALENPKSIYISTSHPTTADRFVTLEEVVEEIYEKEEYGEPLVPERVEL